MFTIPKDKFLYFDGAMGTMIQAKGGNGGKPNEILNIQHPELIRQIHREYLEAGCDILKTNTFGANRFHLAGCGYSVKTVITAAVENAKFVSSGKAFVAMDIGPTGKMLEPLGDLPFEEACEVFGEMAQAGEEAGADLILIETMNDVYELKAAVIGAKDKTSLPIVATVTVDQSGRLLTGSDLAGVLSMLYGLGVQAYGLNCGLSCGQIGELLPQLRQYGCLPIILNPNAGLPVVQKDGKVTYDLTPEKFAAQMAELSEQAGQLLGGCCGTTPEYLRCMIEATKGKKPQNGNRQDTRLASSYRRTALRGEKPLVIADAGEKPLMDAKNGDLYQYVDMGIEFQSGGADAFYLGPCDDADLYETVVKTVQESVTIPLMLDGQNPLSLQKTLRVYNGRPLVYRPAEEALDQVFYYGGIVCDDLSEIHHPEEYPKVETQYVLCRMEPDEFYNL